MAFQQSRRERAASDRAHAMPAAASAAPGSAPPHPGMGSRTLSAPSGGLYKLDSNRKQGPGSRMDQTLAEEDEAPNEISKRSRLPEVTIAVVGKDTAGKSSFINWALDMKNKPFSCSTKKKMSLDGAVYIVRLLEVDLTKVQFDQEHNILWPRLGNDDFAPVVDGVLVLHDATEPEQLTETAELIDSLDASPLPFLLVACKCDLRPEDGDLGLVHERHEIYRTSPESPRSQQMCIALVLRAVISTRADLAPSDTSTISPPAPPPPRTTTKSFQPSPPLDWHHTRANSENPTAVSTGAAGGPATSTLDRFVDGNGGRRPSTDQAPASNLAQQHAPSAPRNARSNSQPVRPQTPTGTRMNTRRPSVQTENSPSQDQQSFSQRMQTTWRTSGGSDAFHSFLNMEDEMEEAPLSPTNVVRPKPSSESNSSAEAGVSFDDLVDRLVAQPMSKHDSKFGSVFLCLYRKFAAPSTLLNALIGRFEKNETTIPDQLARMAEQLRLLNIMAQWASDYPGDFAFPKTRKRVHDFVGTLEKSHFYMFAAKEIGSFLDSNAEDDDIGWAFRDGDVDESSLTETFFDNSGRSSPVPFLNSTYDDDEEEEEDPIYSMSALDLSDGPHDSTSRLSGTLSISSNNDKPSSTLNQSFTVLTLEAAQKEALRLELHPRNPITKVQWRFFMEAPEEEFARQLTRIDWVMYNSFRPRDLVRHVSISGVDKEKVKSLQNVNRMIKQFNHLAFFVASMILLRDKPKHRARCLEKFMGIAVKLRRQNNYNALGAVIAAINGTPVHRLTQTRELIPIQTQKEFMRLVILMSTQRSHFAYRLAWENSFSERIPFLPLHRRDLVSAEEGNKTFVGENKSRINWKKFEVMGEVVLGIQRSQKTPHPQAQKFEDVERLILDCKLSGDEEDLYARSLQVEPSTGGEPVRKKSSTPQPQRNQNQASEMTQPSIQARATYRALLREIPARSRTLNNPSPLQTRIRQLFRSEEQQPSTTQSSSSPSTSSATAPLPFSLPTSAEETSIRIQEAEQLAKYARAQRTYCELLERYNPGMNMDEEERVRLTARRVGFDLPELHDPLAKNE
ncbi:uncharacterized protein N7483_010164 [Penicillium malachiteum]|uniref:uncharacterized protein n=1 Tax=Penicillium malachiteum TaxID=1324776 RepID=UPI0025468F85|nr:uncharacterized protein N7483_010164 [Penicillium malachiteum]KAJ5712983.1 hypothetical protein N7483_010164 [Penicillium malachiteum]